MEFWRQAGMNYVQFSRICAAVVRKSLKPELRAAAIKRDEAHIKAVQWKDGKAIKPDAV